MKKILPLLVLFFLSGAITLKAQTEKNLPPPPPPPKPERIDVKIYKGPNSDFLKQNPTIQKVSWSGNNEIKLKFKTGKEEKYNLNNEDEKKLFTDKYGVPPPPPPPPPPPKPKVI